GGKSTPGRVSASQSRSASWNAMAAVSGSNHNRARARRSSLPSQLPRSPNESACGKADRDPPRRGQSRRRAPDEGSPQGRARGQQPPHHHRRCRGARVLAEAEKARRGTAPGFDSAGFESPQEEWPRSSRRDQERGSAPAHPRRYPHDVASRAGCGRELPAASQRLCDEARGPRPVPQGRELDRTVLARDREAAVSAVARPPNARRPIRVLLVEDNPGDARIIVEMLREVDANLFQLQSVDRLDTALQRLGRATVDVVLLDLGLPDSVGLDTFHRAHREAVEEPIIVISGFDDEDTAVEAVRAGAQDYLVKGRIDG